MLVLRNMRKIQRAKKYSWNQSAKIFWFEIKSVWFFLIPRHWWLRPWIIFDDAVLFISFNKVYSRTRTSPASIITGTDRLPHWSDWIGNFFHKVWSGRWTNKQLWWSATITFIYIRYWAFNFSNTNCVRLAAKFIPARYLVIECTQLNRLYYKCRNVTNSF